MGAIYRLYGLTMESDVHLHDQLEHRGGVVDLRYHVHARGSVPVELDASAIPAYGSPETSAGGEPDFLFYRGPAFDLLRVRDQGEFGLTDRSIHCAGHPDFRGIAELYLLGCVFSLWLETRGTIVLHAAAVALDGAAVVFLAHSGSGKSSLVASLLREGALLLSDDLVALTRSAGGWLAIPAYPQMRMWPHDAEYFLGSVDGLERVHPAFAKLRVPIGLRGWARYGVEPVPIRRIYVLDRREPGTGGDGIELSDPSKTASFFELVAKSFAAGAVEALGLQATRMAALASLLRTVPVRRLSYPSGREHLGRICRAVADDAAGDVGPVLAAVRAGDNPGLLAGGASW